MEKGGKIIRVLRTIGGVGLILFGIVGLFVPVLQGVLFIFGGIMLLFPSNGKDIIKKIKHVIHRFHSHR